MNLFEHLGTHVSGLLSLQPFSNWDFARTKEEDLPETEVYYEFEGHGVDVVCDASERIRTIFLKGGDGEALFGVPFSLKRNDVLDRYGSPSQSGLAVRHPVLGDSGAWDRFTLDAGVLHVQYKFGQDKIEMITLMTADAAP